MGVKGTCRSANGGGVSLIVCSLYIKQAFIRPCFRTPPALTRSKGHLIRAKVAKVNFSLVCFGVLSGILETKKGKSEIYFGFGAFVVLLSSSFVVAVVVSTWCRWCAPAPSLWVCSVPLPCLCPLSCFACGALHLNMALFRVLRGFLAGFGVRMYVCMG